MAITWRGFRVIKEKIYIFHEAIKSYENNDKFKDLVFESIF